MKERTMREHVSARNIDGRIRGSICLVAAGELATDVSIRSAVEASNPDNVTCMECRAVVEMLRASCRTCSRRVEREDKTP